MFGPFFNIIHERVKMFQGTVMQNMKISLKSNMKNCFS